MHVVASYVRYLSSSELQGINFGHMAHCMHLGLYKVACPRIEDLVY